MINLLIAVCLSFFGTSVPASGDLPIKFEEEHVDLGNVIHGEKRSMVYRFQNISRDVIEIDLVSSCECTSLEWSEQPIQPGEFGEIKAVFDSAMKEKSETVDIDIILKNTDPKTGNPYMAIVDYRYNLEK